MGLFNKLPTGVFDNADPSGRQAKLTGPSDGYFDVRSTRVFESKHPKTKGHIVTVIECEMGDNTTEDEHPKGAIRVIKFTCPPDGDDPKTIKVLGNIKGFAAAAKQVNADSLDASILDELEKDPFLFKGARVVYNTSEPIGSKGQEWFLHTFYPATEGELARVRGLVDVATHAPEFADNERDYLPDDDEDEIPF